MASCKEGSKTEYVYLPVDSGEQKPDTITMGQTSHSQGVVDGSGGNITKISYEDFEEFVIKYLPYLSLQLVSRTVKSFSYRNEEVTDVYGGSFYKNIPSELYDLFDDNKEELTKLLTSIKFKPKKESCISNNHQTKEADAAINREGVLCLSYKGFKSFKTEVLMRNLLVMVMHELSHFFGYNEQKAQLVQDFYENHSHGRSLILVDNPSFMTYYFYLMKKTKKFNDMMEYVIKGEYIYACAILNHSYYNMHEDHSTYLFEMPNSLANSEVESERVFLRKNYLPCSLIIYDDYVLKEEDEVEFLKNFYGAYQSKIAFFKELNSYLYPLSPDHLYEDFRVNHYDSIKFSHISGVPSEHGDSLENISCSLIDELGKSVIERIDDGFLSSGYEITTALTKYDFGVDRDMYKRIYPNDEYSDENYKFKVRYEKYSNVNGHFISIKHDEKNLEFRGDNIFDRTFGEVHIFSQKDTFEVEIDVNDGFYLYPGNTHSGGIFFYIPVNVPKVKKTLRLSCSLM